MTTPLGKTVPQPKAYAPKILAAVPRVSARSNSHIQQEAFIGLDRWRAYEFIWFDTSHKANAAILEIEVDCRSTNIVESKSLKMFLNSCYYRNFDSTSELKTELSSRLTDIVDGEVRLQLLAIEDAHSFLTPVPAPGICLDRLNATGEGKLQIESAETHHQKIHSNLFRSLCPVTGQPDWASLLIEYRGAKLKLSSVLGYLQGYAEHSGFHESCVELIFKDIRALEGVEDVAVCAKFLRRGGIDISPFRSSTTEFLEPRIRLLRQ